MIKILCEAHRDPYVMSKANVYQLLIDALAMRVLNPRYELEESKVSMCTTYKRVSVYKDIFLVF